MERQENYICGEVRTAAACRAAAFEGVLPLFLGFPVPVFVNAMPVQAVSTGSVGITTLEGETYRSPSQEPYGSQASRSLMQQEDSGKVSHDEKFQVFVQGAGLGSATRVLWVTAHTTVADACFALGLTGVLPNDVYGSIGSKLLGWNDRLAQGGACKGSRLVLCRRTRGGGGPRQPLYDEWTCAREMAGCWAMKRSCFRCGLSRAESERILRSNPKGRIRKVPPRERANLDPAAMTKLHAEEKDAFAINKRDLEDGIVAVRSTLGARRDSGGGRTAPAIAGERVGILGISRDFVTCASSFNSSCGSSRACMSYLDAVLSASARAPAAALVARSSAPSSSAVGLCMHAHGSLVHDACSNSWSDTVRKGPTGRRCTKGGVSSPVEDFLPVSEVEAGVNFRPAGWVRGRLQVHFSGPCMMHVSIRGRTWVGHRFPRAGGAPKVGFPVRSKIFFLSQRWRQG